MIEDHWLITNYNGIAIGLPYSNYNFHLLVITLPIFKII